MVCLPQKVASNDSRCLKDFESLAANSVRGGGGNGNVGSLSDGSGICMGLGLIAGVIAGASVNCDIGVVSAATVEVFEFSE